MLSAAALTLPLPEVQARPPAGAEVINAGVGGNNTADLLKRMQKDCLDHRPSLTVLMCGTNDMNSMKYIPLPQYRQNMASIIEAIKATKSKVVLMTILPYIEDYLFTRHKKEHYGAEGPAARRAAVNDTIRGLAKQYKTSLLDLGHIFDRVGNIGKDKSSLIMNEANSNKTDGVHPTADGYRLIGVSVYDYITYHQLPTSKIVCFGDSITNGGGGVEGTSYPANLKRLLA
ncbi:SGNH/GDSL hydrolase family protein [Chitinophaga horti]|uniref:SGNH/GDSL hydrolase family protein n=1 Tax=Chitinophaga horti TaxID=2920382 RepID=A0ABY6IYM0_9BACT|nr:SGNH/GDSL hydrolase family protein [Chitinophaga horti]UYQ92494.1 SGNH/GDSL hydrolase family protein [Chitinophaga horti]